MSNQPNCICLTRNSSPGTEWRISIIRVYFQHTEICVPMKLNTVVLSSQYLQNHNKVKSYYRWSVITDHCHNISHWNMSVNQMFLKFIGFLNKKLQSNWLFVLSVIYISQHMKQIFTSQLNVIEIIYLQVQTVMVHSHWQTKTVPLSASSCLSVCPCISLSVSYCPHITNLNFQIAILWNFILRKFTKVYQHIIFIKIRQ